MNTRYAEEVFDGIVLSDGTIGRRPNSQFLLATSNKRHLDLLTLTKNALTTLGIEVPPHHPAVIPRISSHGKKYSYYYIESRTSPLLLAQRDRWYIEGIKAVPRDFVFTPTSLACEFMGDGSSTWVEGSYVQAWFSTQGIYILSMPRLELLLSSLGIRTHRSYRNHGIALYVTDSDSITTLMNIIEPHILPSFSYKIKRPGMKEARRRDFNDITIRQGFSRGAVRKDCE